MWQKVKCNGVFEGLPDRSGWSTYSVFEYLHANNKSENTTASFLIWCCVLCQMCQILSCTALHMCNSQQRWQQSEMSHSLFTIVISSGKKLCVQSGMLLRHCYLLLRQQRYCIIIIIIIKKPIKLNSSPVYRKRFHCNFSHIYMHHKNTANTC